MTCGVTMDKEEEECQQETSGGDTLSPPGCFTCGVVEKRSLVIKVRD
jgi:hypothetical protein